MFEQSNFVFPNDVHIDWSLMIVIYPYITGLVAGAFIVSSFYHVFGKKEFKPISKFSLLASLSLLLCATLPLLNHLGHPERAFNIMITPNFNSAMSGFGFLYSFYMIILLLEVWLVFREDIIIMARESRGLKRLLYKVLALGVYDVSPEALKKDHIAINILAAIGIPAACLLHGYVGFLFGALKSNPWWSTPLMPIIFLFSAVVSGIALLIILYQVICKFNGWKIDRDCISSLTKMLWFVMIISVSLELLEIITLAYEQAEEWEIIYPLLFDKLSFSFISVQLIIGSLIPFILLMFAVLMDKYMQDKFRNTITLVSSLLLMLQVISMRWNVIIGGQTFSKSLRGFREYHPLFLEKEGILATIILLSLPFIILFVVSKILPPFKNLVEPESNTQENS